VRLSIVIPSFNQGAFIAETLDCLFDQQDVAPDELEVIVMDGGSTDQSVEIIKSRADRLAYWVSEPDGGQTDALIKGFNRATGDIFGWLCSDDLLEPRTVREVLDFFAGHPDTEFVFGDTTWIDRDGEIIKRRKEIPFSWFIWAYGYNYLPQPSTFWRRGLYERVGGLRAEFNCAMDADLWGRFAQESPPVHVRKFWSRARMYPEQKNQALRAQSDIEDRRLRIELGYPLDRPLFRSAMYVLARSTRVAWRAVTGCYT